MSTLSAAPAAYTVTAIMAFVPSTFHHKPVVDNSNSQSLEIPSATVSGHEDLFKLPGQVAAYTTVIASGDSSHVHATEINTLPTETTILPIEVGKEDILAQHTTTTTTKHKNKHHTTTVAFVSTTASSSTITTTPTHTPIHRPKDSTREPKPHGGLLRLIRDHPRAFLAVALASLITCLGLLFWISLRRTRSPRHSFVVKRLLGDTDDDGSGSQVWASKGYGSIDDSERRVGTTPRGNASGSTGVKPPGSGKRIGAHAAGNQGFISLKSKSELVNGEGMPLLGEPKGPGKAPATLEEPAVDGPKLPSNETKEIGTVSSKPALVLPIPKKCESKRPLVSAPPGAASPFMSQPAMKRKASAQGTGSLVPVARDTTKESR